MQNEERASDSLTAIIDVLNELAEHRTQVLRVLYELGNLNAPTADALAAALNEENRLRQRKMDETVRVLVMHAMNKGREKWLSQLRVA